MTLGEGRVGGCSSHGPLGCRKGSCLSPDSFPLDNGTNCPSSGPVEIDGERQKGILFKGTLVEDRVLN